jgi:CHAT domain
MAIASSRSCCARPRRIKERIKSFRPHIVHFLCHGQPAQDGAPAALILPKDDPDQGPTGEADHVDDNEPIEEAAYDGDQILKWLSADDTIELPSIVVLSACHTADGKSIAEDADEPEAPTFGRQPGRRPELQSWGVHEAGPLAARLVEGRVPIVVGMAGAVSDRGCRLFTRRFGAALLEGFPLIAAASQARSAALSEGERAYKSADWALPVLFMAEAVEPDHVPVLLPAPPEAGSHTGVDERIAVYDVERKPVFCGRHEFFDAYHELVQPVAKGRCSVLAAYSETVESGLGHSRLLQELTAQAVRDHHIPCLIGSDQPGWRPPTSRNELIAAFYDAIIQARQAFLQSVAFRSQLNVLREKSGKELRSCRALDLEVKATLSERAGHELTVSAVRMALKKDLDKLRSDVSERCPDVAGAGGQVLFLFDKVDQYAAALDDLLSGLLGPNGLTASAPPVPVIMTLTASGTLLQSFVRNAERHRPWLRPIPLKPFGRKGNEDLMECERVLLHPYLARPEKATKAWMINWGANLEGLEEFHTDHLQGIPGHYTLPSLYAYLIESIREGIILPADDTAFVKLMPDLK